MIASNSLFLHVFLLIFPFTFVFSQKSTSAHVDQINHEVLIQINRENDIKLLKNKLELTKGLDFQEQLTKDGLIFSLTVNNASQRNIIIEEIANWSFVKYVSANKRTKDRGFTPNDDKFYKQYSLQNMEMDELWCNGVNGVTSRGDTIVVAVVESASTSFFHQDINENLWINHSEIPNDGIDNDNNGYIDDYYGLNAEQNVGTNLELGNNSHGLSVMGVIGARGDNGTGIAGMHWNVKILNVTKAKSEIQAVKAYDYIYELRKAYNESNGSEGAFIVASNSSFGIDMSFPSDEPIWCEQYEKLYNVGVINISASRNDEVNIDIEGDIPSLCQSNSLVTVSNITRTDAVEPSGYSPENIDLAAYGVSISSLAKNDSIYDQYTGTSYSAPHVTGLVALLYGQACDKFIDLSKANPENAVDLMKGFILDKCLPITSQMNRSITEGKLNPKGTQDLLYFYCDAPQSELGINYIYYNSSDNLTVDFSIPGPGDVEFKVHNMLGQEVMQKIESYSIEDIWTTELELQNFPTGIYHLSISRSQSVKTKSFMIF